MRRTLPDMSGSRPHWVVTDSMNLKSGFHVLHDRLSSIDHRLTPSKTETSDVYGYSEYFDFCVGKALSLACLDRRSS